MNHGSLFSGIGGFDLAAEWMGWQNVFHCEWNEFGQKVLKHYWPKSISYHDITKTDFTIHRGHIDILTGGFPCQPYSMAGKRKGKEDERHLWPEMLRAIREIQPRWVVGENVLGLVNWSGGLVFHEVQANLEAAGYEVWPYVLPAIATDACHRRDRIFFVAYSNGRGSTRLQYKLGKPKKTGQRRQDNEKVCDKDAAEPMCIRQHGQRRAEISGNTTPGRDWKEYRAFDAGGWPIESPVRREYDGISHGLDGITFSNWAKESIKGYGNAVVPQVVYQIFKTIEQYETKTNRL
jgi:DNA (cytosine-5)-methyltransferase 1